MGRRGKTSAGKTPVAMTITFGIAVHVNRLRHCIQLEPDELSDTLPQPFISPWNLPQIEHSVILAESPEQHYPARETSSSY